MPDFSMSSTPRNFRNFKKNASALNVLSFLNMVLNEFYIYEQDYKINDNEKIINDTIIIPYLTQLGGISS
jgi:hypothetical protein